MIIISALEHFLTFLFFILFSFQKFMECQARHSPEIIHIFFNLQYCLRFHQNPSSSFVSFTRQTPLNVINIFSLIWTWHGWMILSIIKKLFPLNFTFKKFNNNREKICHIQKIQSLNLSVTFSKIVCFIIWKCQKMSW